MQFVHENDIAGCLEHAVRHDLDGAQLRRRRGPCPDRGRVAALQAAGAAAAAVGHRGGRRRAEPGRRGADPARAREPAALRAGAGQPPDEGHRLPLPLHHARNRPSSCASTSACCRQHAPPPAYRYEEYAQEVFRAEPERAHEQRARRPRPADAPPARGAAQGDRRGRGRRRADQRRARSARARRRPRRSRRGAGLADLLARQLIGAACPRAPSWRRCWPTNASTAPGAPCWPRSTRH